MALSENIAAMVTNTCNILRDNLHDRYDSGFPVLKELIQNANDACASELLISKCNGLKNTSHPLLEKPTLLVFNDGKVTEDDLRGIISVAQGGKTGKAGVIGKFGLGMKSIFHFCDMFFYVAFINYKPHLKLVNPFIDPLRGEDPYHKDWNNLSNVDEKAILDYVNETVGNRKDGLLLWIPLRDESYKYKILNDIYKIENIWKQDSAELKRNVAISLAALDISTPCNGGIRNLQKVEIETQNPPVHLMFPTGTHIIKSDEEEYCSLQKSKPIDNTEGKALLRELINKDKFTKISYVNEEGEEKEISSYDENQTVSLGLLKFNNDVKSLNFDWCSYLPLGSKADSINYFDYLDGEYHIIIHANFAIDSGRRGIVSYADCINKNSILDFEAIDDDKASQTAWNKILIRNFILPNLLNFISLCKIKYELIESLYSVICDSFNPLGYFALNKGFTYFINNDWKFHKTENIQETAYKLIDIANAYFSDKKNLEDFKLYSITVNICNYIQNNTENTNWAVVHTGSDINNSELAKINDIARTKSMPILFLPEAMVDIKTTSYKFTDVEKMVDFLLCFQEDEIGKDVYKKIGYLFGYICADKCIERSFCTKIYSDYNIRQFIPLFQMAHVDDSPIKYTYIYKTYDEVTRMSRENRLFSHYGKDGKNSLLQKYYKMFPKIELYMMSGDVSRSEFFIQDLGDESFYRYSYEEEEQNDIRVLNHKKIETVLFSMQSHLDLINQTDVETYSSFIRDVQAGTDDIRTKYYSTIRAILVGHKIEDSRKLFHHSEQGEYAKKSVFYQKLLSKYTQSYLNDSFINSEIDIAKILFEPLAIEEKTCNDLEEHLGEAYYHLNELTTDECDLLAEYIEDTNIFKQLPIHRTIDNKYVNLREIGDRLVYLENPAINFPPNGYKIPEKYKIIKINEKSRNQKIIPTLQAANIANILLLDEDNNLGNPSGIVLCNYLNSLIKSANVKTEDIYPNSRDRKWIPDFLNHYYSFNEIIDNSSIGPNTLELCDGIILTNQVNEDFLHLKKFFIKDDEEILKSLIQHHKKEGKDAWPWFNINDYKSLTENDDKLSVYKVIENTKDSVIQIIRKFKNEEQTIDYLKTSINCDFVKNSDILENNKTEYLIRICSDVLQNTKVPEYLNNHLIEVFSSLSNKEDFLMKATENTCLPSAVNIWTPISKLVNFKDEIPDLFNENRLNSAFFNFFPFQTERSGGNNNYSEIKIDEFIEKIAVCKNKKLWGAFCYLISKTEDQVKLYSHGELFEHKTRDELKSFHLPQLSSSKIILHPTEGNYCTSLTGARVELKDAVDVDSVFYNNPTFENRNLIVDLFDNFTKFSANSIQNAIGKLFNIFEINNVSENFFYNLANPTQAPLNTAINMIFTNIFSTLKILKLQYKAGQYNLIAEAWENYREASGEKNHEKMEQCNESIKHYIETDSGGIQAEIRRKVISYIQDAEYKERCILFELFQNADDAYVQASKAKADFVPYFKITGSSIALNIEHAGRPINQFRVGSPKEYKEDLTNMLNIGWSDKTVVQGFGRQTGKFGYGFKTVYLICDEPHVISGDYNFIIKAALYPEQAQETIDYTDKTYIQLKLNENGQKHRTEILDEFKIAARYQVMFSKRIRSIECPGQTYNWKPTKSAELTNFIVEQDDSFVLFKTKLDNPEISDLQAALAFRKIGDKIVQFDEEAPKIWCMAPLLDLQNIGFAISANFKTNTGRQTLALENNDNLNLIDKVSSLFSKALIELWNNDEYKHLIPSLINVTLIGTTKTIFEKIPKKILSEFLKIKLIPDGIDKLMPYTKQKLYSLSATYFNDKFQTQFEKISEGNLLINRCKNENMLLLTQIAADELRDLGLGSENLGKAISLLDKLLSTENTIEKQKEIIKNFAETSLYEFVQSRKEKLSDCSLFNSENELKKISEIYEVSDDYDSSKTILHNLFDPSRAAVKKHEEDYANNPGLFDDIDDDQPVKKYISFRDIYERWKSKEDSNQWEKDKKNYYDNLYPTRLSINSLGHDLKLSDSQLMNIEDGTIPENWCLFIMIAMCQSLNIFKNTDVANRNAINWLDEKKLISDFCSGMNLQDLYDNYLKNSGKQDYLRHFELLLRIYSIRKDFMTFYTLISQLPENKSISDIEQFLIVSTDSELTGMGISMNSLNKSLKLGISMMIRDLLLSGFWNSTANKDGIKNIEKFAYMPKTVTTASIGFTNFASSEDIYNEITKQIQGEESANIFIENYDLPFLIYGKEQ